MSARQRWLLGGLVVLSATNAVLSAFAMGRGAVISEGTQMLWYFVYSLLAAAWLKNDIAEREADPAGHYPTFVIFLLWPILMPYHLLRSRGLEGLVLFIGFAATYLAPYFVQLVIWAEGA